MLCIYNCIGGLVVMRSLKGVPHVGPTITKSLATPLVPVPSNPKKRRMERAWKDKLHLSTQSIS